MRADIHGGQEHKRSVQGPDTEAQDLFTSKSSLSACNARPVHTEVPRGDLSRCSKLSKA
jgi:hypothetical protein